MARSPELPLQARGRHLEGVGTLDRVRLVEQDPERDDAVDGFQLEVMIVMSNY